MESAAMEDQKLEDQALAHSLLASPLLASPAAFSVEQKEYLLGFLAGAMQRGGKPFTGENAAGQIADAARAANGRESARGAAEEAAEETVHGTPVSELCREERWKHDEDPLEMWEKLLAHAAENRAPDAEDLFRFKYHGLFYVAPAQDSFMVRLRVAGGALRAHQMRGLAEMSERWGAGGAAITTRANVQMREFAPRDIVRVLTTLDELGLTSRGAGADNIRNITASPVSGIDPQELIDARPLATALHHYILHSRDLYDLPRKFNVAFDGGGAISVVADTNDIGFVAVRVGEGRSVPPGIYFRVLLCGITGHRQFAGDCGLLVRPEQAVAVAVAMIRVYAEHGDRTDRRKARLKYLVDRWGVEKFVAEAEKRLGIPLLRVAAGQCEARGPVDRAAHIGAHRQSQPGRQWLGVVVPVGQLSAEQMRAVAAVAEEMGSGELRLTVWQNLIVPDLRDERVAEAVERLHAAGLESAAGSVLRGTVACTGNRGCRYAATDTKRHAVELAHSLDKRFPIEQPVNLHVTGCPHSCAQHYVGDIGLLGTKVNGEEGYQVVIGGGSDSDQGLARELIPAVAWSELPARMESLFGAYVERRAEQETFLEFSRRHSIAELQSFLTDKELEAR